MYYIIICNVRAIPTYRDYQLYDIVYTSRTLLLACIVMAHAQAVSFSPSFSSTHAHIAGHMYVRTNIRIECVLNLMIILTHVQ